MARGRLALAVGVGVALGAPSHADADAAAERRARADQLAVQGQFLDAAAAYLEAYAIDHNAELVCNAGVAYLKARELPRARLYLDQCQARGTEIDEHFIADVRANLNDIDASLRTGEFTPVEVVVDPTTALVAGDDFAPHGAVPPGVIWLTPGPHVLTVTAEGYLDRKVEISAAGKAVLRIQIKLDPVPLEPRIVYRRVPPAPVRTIWPISATVATLAFAAFADVAQSQANKDATRAGFALNEPTFKADSDAVNSWNRAFGLAVGGAVVGAVAGGYLWLRHFRHRTVDIDLKPGVALLTLTMAM